MEQAELGLIYFVARFYDPVLTHFVQADTIIPDPGDPLAWDRYAYVKSNPIRYSDPTGHKVCEGTKDCNNPIKTVFTKSDYRRMLSDEFGWTVYGNNWRYGEMQKIYETANDILAYANNTVNNGAGLGWMEKYIGDANFYHNLIENIFPNNFVPEGNTVVLLSSWSKDPRGPKNILAHELGHVVDNRSASGFAVWTGGGFGDRLAVEMGSFQTGLDITFPRFINGSGGISPQNSWPGEVGDWSYYGNNSTPDYFAHTFTFAVLKIDGAPKDAVDFLNQLISESYDY